ncbi:hypothetical protein PEC18_08910 [Paucibacter sp. O1-1]|nr:hypothetical protein [Paucibacter sp. O1-1]MDA3825981.1 hypothetical protein [Paucibacter sp. O1-1]
MIANEMGIDQNINAESAGHRRKIQTQMVSRFSGFAVFKDDVKTGSTFTPRSSSDLIIASTKLMFPPIQ